MSLSDLEMKQLTELAEQLKIKTKYGWENFCETVHNPSAFVLDFETISQLQQFIAEVHELNKVKPPTERIILRAAAGGRELEYSESFSLTPVVDADIVVRLVGQAFCEISKTDDPLVMRVGGSLQIGELDAALYEHHQLSLPTSSLIPYVTVAGLSANAGHGTGRDQPGFCGLIRAMTFCLPNGEIVRIDKSHPDFKTIAACHLGLFGIVLNVELECTPAKKMLCRTIVTSIPVFLERVRQGLYNQYPYVSVMYVPTYADDLTNQNQHNVIIYAWEPVDLNVPDANEHPTLDKFIQSLEVDLQAGSHINDLIRAYPHLIPYYSRYLVAHFAVGDEGSVSVGPWPSVHYLRAYPSDIADADYLFPVNPNYEEIVGAMEHIVATLSQYASREEYPLTDAVYLRLFSGTSGGLSTSSHGPGQRVCGLDMVSCSGIESYSRFRDEMADFFVNGPLHAKPHWGKYLPLNIDYPALYGEKCQEFMNALLGWYEAHKMDLSHAMLLNRFQCQIWELTEYAPQNRLTLASSSGSSQPMNVHAVAQHLRDKIESFEHDHPAALELIKRLGGLTLGQSSGQNALLFPAPASSSAPGVRIESGAAKRDEHRSEKDQSGCLTTCCNVM